MTLEELVEAHLAGESVVAPEALRDEFDRAVAGYAALSYALDETIGPDGADATDRAPPTLPDDYRVVRELGRGGMGVVYLVEQKSLERLLAVKVLRPGEATFGRVVQRFLEEARHLARLRHSNIVSVHEVGQAGQEPYFTMDYVDGRPLSAMLANGKLSPTQALALWKQAAAGVQHAHAQGIIHRDLKPGNILVDASGHAYVTDFGLARDMTQSSQLTRTGEVMGTPAYMAPEQALGELGRIGEATDVHALGVVLYEMLTGTPPYGRDAPARVLVRLLNDELQPLRTLDHRIPRDLETICLKAMAREPERRYANVAALLEDIRRYEAGEPVQARRPGPVYRAARLARRHVKTVAAVVATALVVAAMALLFTRQSADATTAEGDSLHALGRNREALDTYRQALDKSWAPERLRVLERIVRSAREVGDDRAGVDAAVSFLQFDPWGWFGEYNWPVAQRVVRQQVAVRKNLTGGSPEAFTTLELAALRLRMFLAGPDGTDDERRAAELELADVAAALGTRAEESMAEIFPGWKPRDGEPDSFLKQSEDTTSTLTERAQAAYLAAAHFEKHGRRSDAVAAYRRAFELLRQYNPAYFGLVNGIESNRVHSLRHEATSWPRVLRHVAGTIRRLEPESPPLLRGGLRVRLAGLDIPPELGLHIAISLWDPDVADTGRGSETIDGQNVPAVLGEIPLQIDQTGWVGVADGRYRLALRRGSTASTVTKYLGAQGSQMYLMLQLDYSDLPREIEIRGTKIDLPPIRAHLVEEIRRASPAENAEIDFTDAEFRWNPVPNATRYEVVFLSTTSNGFGGTYLNHLLSVEVENAAGLQCALLPADDAGKLRSLVHGATGVWEVSAYDDKDRLIARTPQQLPFVVVRRNVP